MTSQEIYFLQRKKLELYNYTVEDLNMLKNTVTEELDARLEIDSKEKAIELAEKVEKETGKDQHIQKLKDELFSARQSYAQRISNFDENRYMPGYVAYNPQTGLPYGVNDEDDRLAPIEEDDNHLKRLPQIESPQEQYHPQWQITTINEDGTEEVIGYS